MVFPNSPRHDSAESGLRAWISKTPYYKLRHRAFLLFTIFALILPFIKINGNQVFMLSFLHLEFHLLGVSYDMQELYLIPLILILAFVFVFLATSLGGRMWCGWGCPQTMFRTLYRDFIQEKVLGLRKFHLKTRPLKLQKWPERFKFLLGILLLTPLMFAASANILWFFVAPHEFFYLLLNNPQEHSFLFAFWVLLALFLIIDIVWLG
jgi:polyferredoxin